MNVCKRGRGRVVTTALEARRDGFLIVGDCVERGRVISGGSLARHAWSVLLLEEGVGCYSGCSELLGLWRVCVGVEPTYEKKDLGLEANEERFQ